MKHQAYLSLGSNQGNREEYLKQAIEELRANAEIIVKTVSSIYETLPFGNVLQENFYNLAVEIQTNLSPRELLQEIHRIEEKLHRVRTIRWGPRTIDIDILLVDELMINEPDLIIPHLGIRERRFVLEPLYEIARDLTLPTGERIEDLLRAVITPGNQKFL